MPLSSVGGARTLRQSGRAGAVALCGSASHLSAGILPASMIPARAMTLSAVNACIGVGASIVEGLIWAISNLCVGEREREERQLGKLARGVGPARFQGPRFQGLTSKVQVCPVYGVCIVIYCGLLQTKLLGIEWCAHDHRHLTGRNPSTFARASLPTWTASTSKGQ